MSTGGFKQPDLTVTLYHLIHADLARNGFSLANHLANLLKVEIGGRPNAVDFIDDDIFCIAGEVLLEPLISC